MIVCAIDLDTPEAATVTGAGEHSMKRQIFTSLVVLTCAFLVGRPVAADFVAGGLYATAESLNQVIQINSDGTTSVALNVISNPMGLAFRSSNELYVSGRPYGLDGVGAVFDYRSDGSVVFTAPSIPVTNTEPNGNWGGHMAFDAQGNAYVPTWNSPGATLITANGVVSDWTGYQYGLWWGRAAAFSPTGQLYMIQGLDYGSNPTSTVATIDTVTGAVSYVFQNLPLLNGLAIDSQGNIYLSEYLQNEIVKIAAGTDTITPFASLAVANVSGTDLAIGPDDRLYAVGRTQTGADQIWSFNLSTGAGELYATNLPNITDIAFAPAAVPEPSTILMMVIALPFSLLLVSEKAGIVKHSRTVEIE